MGVQAKYEVIGTVRDGLVQTLRAREKVSGREALIHVVEAGNSAVVQRLGVLTADKRAHVLEEVEEGGMLFVVTDTSVQAAFEEWIAVPPADRFGQTGKWDITRLGMKAADSPPETPREPGEFTRMFQSPAEPPVQELPASERPTEVMEPPPLPPKPAARPGTPGEFTRMFQPPAVTADVENAPPLAAPDEPPKGWVFTKVFDKPQSSSPPGATGSGAFTRMFQPPPVEKSAAPPTPPSAPEPGAFTRMFQPPAPEKPATPPPQQPGEFTRMFNAPPPAQSGPFPAPNPHQPPPGGDFNRMLAGEPGPGTGGGEFTRIFGRQTTPAPETTPPAPPASRQGPGEFTRMFDAPSPSPPVGSTPTGEPAAPPHFQAPPLPQMQPPQVQPPQFQGPQFQGPQYQAPQFQGPQLQGPQFQAPQFPASPPAPPPRAQASYLPLVLILAGLLAVAILLVVYFALR